MAGDWLKAERTCPVCNRRHEWTPFCPGCGYEYAGKAVHETEEMIGYEPEPSVAEKLKEGSATTKAFFDANPDREFLLRRANRAECQVYDAKIPGRKIGNKRRLYVITRKVAEEDFRSVSVPIPRADVKTMPEPTEEFCRYFWHKLLPEEMRRALEAFNPPGD